MGADRHWTGLAEGSAARIGVFLNSSYLGLVKEARSHVSAGSVGRTRWRSVRARARTPGRRRSVCSPRWPPGWRGA